jgi:hypothetical protein
MVLILEKSFFCVLLASLTCKTNCMFGWTLRNARRTFMSKTTNYKNKQLVSTLFKVRGGGKSASPTSSTVPIEEQLQVDLDQSTFHKMVNNTDTFTNSSLNFVFSDVDGTLVHYPDDTTQNDDVDILYLPPSSTGMRGIISAKTLQLCQIIRKDYNAKLILVSGMRTSTLLKRLPYLPKADAYASEAGGRIFYPETDLSKYNGTVITPVKFTGSSESDLSPFGLKEDMDWRNELSKESAAGTDGYVGDVIVDFLCQNKEDNEIIPISDRQGALWNFAKNLESEGFVLDYKGYSCCFRVNRKQQNNERISSDDFDSLSLRDLTKTGLATSVNLGCIDFYPKSSGKKNWLVLIYNNYNVMLRLKVSYEF